MDGRSSTVLRCCKLCLCHIFLTKSRPVKTQPVRYLGRKDCGCLSTVSADYESVRKWSGGVTSKWPVCCGHAASLLTSTRWTGQRSWTETEYLPMSPRPMRGGLPRPTDRCPGPVQYFGQDRRQSRSSVGLLAAGRIREDRHFRSRRMIE